MYKLSGEILAIDLSISRGLRSVRERAYGEKAYFSGIGLVVHRAIDRVDVWRVTEPFSGRYIASGPTMSDALSEADRVIEKIGPENVKQMIAEAMTK